ncbi:general substrate transporter [Laetiporus sulphureus 93-53]|uniref:General substrate transporter n=1 Tax=Laetiporus sulphureus 93-53 TaxID=1314785 RepID=A0A165E6T5_9APHY|nr:general substrate transporter [Laetiporus sulphureus 93-53]KZT06349.1 general substrate transporter [Laetiporus sulphureus 93-53]
MDADASSRGLRPCLPNPPLSVIQQLRSYRLPLAVDHVPNYVWCALFTAVGGFIFGFDTGSIGSITTMPQFVAQISTDGKLSSTLQGLIVSTILITASLASLFSGPLSDRISRIRTISLSAIVFAAGSTISCSAHTLAQLFVGRCVAGIGEGLFLSTVTVYAVEIAPASARGRIGSMVQMLCTIGIASGYFVCYGSACSPSSFSWRFPFGMQAVVSVMLAAGAPFLPYSPRWLRMVGRDADAEAAWLKLGVNTADVEKIELNVRGNDTEGNWWEETKLLWMNGVRTRTALGVFLMAMQQASGIDGVLYYAPVLFSQAGLSASTASFIASGVSGMIMVVFTFGVQFFADKWGRRASMIRGGAVIGTAMLIIGSIYASHASDHAAGRWAIIVLIYVFVVGYVATWAIVVRIIASEIQPMRTRAAATSLGQCANWVVNWIIAFTTPAFLAKTSSGPYLLFGSCSLLTTVICLAFQPETKGASLEEVDKVFEEAPWRAALQKHRARSHSERNRRNDSPIVIAVGHNPVEGFEEVELIRLPEVRFCNY